MTAKRSITARLNPTRKAKMEALASTYYNGSQADTIRRWIDEQFAAVFGDLDPTAVLDGRVDADNVTELMRQPETDPDTLLEELDIDDELRLDDDDTVPATAPDGGAATHQPERFQTMLGPRELAQSGPALEWDELRDIVADDGHWSDALEIHPDRVPPGTLKSNHKLTPRVIAAIARSKAQGGFVRHETVEKLVSSKLRHLHDRVDRQAGMQYIKRTYIPLIERHLGAHPRPDSAGYFVDKAKRTAVFESRIEDPWTELETTAELTPATVLDPDAWQAATDRARFNKREWHADLGCFLTDIATLAHIQEHIDVTRGVDAEALAVVVPDQHADVAAWLDSTVQQLLGEFLALREHPATEDIVGVVLEHHVSEPVADVIRDRLTQ